MDQQQYFAYWAEVERRRRSYRQAMRFRDEMRFRLFLLVSAFALGLLLAGACL